MPRCWKLSACGAAKLGTPEGDRLDVLATLIDSYERHTHSMDPPDPIEAIKFRMSQQKLTRKQLEPMIGTRTRVCRSPEPADVAYPSA